MAFYCGHRSLCDSQKNFTIHSLQRRSPNEIEHLEVLAAAPSSLGSATDTLGSHNPSTFSGSIVTLPSVADGPTGSVTSNVVPTTTSTSLSTASNSTTSSAPGSTGTSSGETRRMIRDSALTIFAIFFGLGASVV